MNSYTPPTNPIPGMTDKRYNRLRTQGRIVTRYKVKVGQQFEDANGRTKVRVNKGGTIVNLIPKPKMSKKARRKWRKEQENA